MSRINPTNSTTKECEQCGILFEAKRATARFCSTNCRVKAAQKANVNPDTGEIIEPESLLLIPVAVGGYGSAGEVASKAVEKEIDWKRYEDPNDPLYEPNPFKRPGDPSYDSEAALKAFQKMGLDAVEWITTGIKEFDELTRIPVGRITQIQGPYGVGKTTLCLNMVRGVSQTNKVLYIDSEAALNPGLLKDLRVNQNNFTLYNESAALEDISEVIRAAVKEPKYDLIIFDSLAMTNTRTIQESDITASNIGQKAKLVHKLISLVQMDLKRTKTALVVINQEREMIGTYVPTKYTPGGTAVPYAASLIIALKTIKSWRFPDKPKSGIYEGQQVEATIIKSKVNTPWRIRKFRLYYPNPIDNA